MAAKLRLALCCSTKRVRLAAPRASAPSSQYHAVKVRPELGGYGGEGGGRQAAGRGPTTCSESQLGQRDKVDSAASWVASQATPDLCAGQRALKLNMYLGGRTDWQHQSSYLAT